MSQKIGTSIYLHHVSYIVAVPLVCVNFRIQTQKNEAIVATTPELVETLNTDRFIS